MNPQTVLDNLSMRIIPDSKSEIIDYYNVISIFNKVSISFKSLLLVGLEKLKEDAIDFGVEHSGKDKSYIYHLLRIGRMLIRVEYDVFKIFEYFSFDKFMEILALDNDVECGSVEDFVKMHGEALIEMNKTELQEKCYEFRGKKPREKGKGSESGTWQPDLFGAVEAVGMSNTDSILSLSRDERFNDQSALKFSRSGMGLIEVCIDYWSTRGMPPNTDKIATMEGILLEYQCRLKELRLALTEAQMAK